MTQTIHISIYDPCYPILPHFFYWVSTSDRSPLDDRSWSDRLYIGEQSTSLNLNLIDFNSFEILGQRVSVIGVKFTRYRCNCSVFQDNLLSPDLNSPPPTPKVETFGILVITLLSRDDDTEFFVGICYSFIYSY